MTNAEIILHLIDARKRLAQGWCQGALHRFNNERHERCLVGALMESWDLTLKEVLSLPDDGVIWWPSFHDLIGWNDEPGRTQEEVLDLVDRAITSVMKVEAAEVVERKELVSA